MNTILKAISEFFTPQNRNHYNPSDSNRENCKDHEGTRKESFRSLDPCEADVRENDKTSLASTKKPLSMEEFTFITPIPQERYDDVIAHLRIHFTDELMIKHLELFNPGDSQAKLEGYNLGTLHNQLSLIAVDKDTSKVIAVSLNAIQYPGEAQRKNKRLRNMSDEEYKRAPTLSNDINESIDLFFKFNVEKIFAIHIFSVDTNYLERGLDKEIITRVEKLAGENGFKIMRAEASESFFLKMLSSLGWKLVPELKCEDHFDKNRVQTVKSPAPNKLIKTMVKKCSNSVNT